MNREIKFRGKRKDNGEWIYGSLFNCPNSTCPNLSYYIIPDNCAQCNLCDDSMQGFKSKGVLEVVPESIGQFTGLKDKNGKEIYESDIIKYTVNSFKGEAEVIFDTGCFCLKYKQMLDIDYPCLALADEGSFEIIGNVWQNPELAETKK